MNIQEQIIARYSTLLAIILGSATPVYAGTGVKYAHLESLAVDCSPGNPLPCQFPAGTPQTESNVIFVLQTPDQNGDLQFNALATNMAGDDFVWVGTKYEAKCKVGRHFEDVWLKTGFDFIAGDAPSEVVDCGENCDFEQSEPVNVNNRTIPWRHRPFAIPLDVVLDKIGLTEADLYAMGEALVAERMDGGMSEADARFLTEDKVKEMPMALQVECKGAFFPYLSWGGDSTTAPISIRFLGHGESAGLQLTDPAPASGGQIDPQYVDETSVTQAQLFAIPEETGCGLNLSAVFTTNDQTAIEYRLVDDLGVKSQIFRVPVDHTFTAYVNHELDLTDVIMASGEPGLVAPEAPAGDLGYATEETDRRQGYYQVEVILPHHKMSNVASYNMVACMTESDPPQTRQ